jgi:hypothetical protein
MVRTTQLSTHAGNPLGGLLRSLAIGVGYTLAVMAGGMIADLLRLPLPGMASQMDPVQSLISVFLSGTVIGLTLGPLAARLRLPPIQRAGLLFGTFFILNSLVNVIEAFFFTTAPPIEQLHGLVTSAVGHAGLAALLALWFRPQRVDQDLPAALGDFFSQRRWIAWIWRIGLAGALYLPIYFIFGMIIYPIVQPYYQDPALGLNLTVPGLELVLPLELGRGLLLVLTVLPLIAVLPTTRWILAFWLGITLVVLCALTPMLQASSWPLTMRLVHGLEITADAAVHALFIAWLLGRPSAGQIKPTP